MSTDRFAEVERLYHEAMLRPPEERAAFLNQACGGDESLRHEVESLLSLKTDADGFLSRTALEEAARAGHRPWEPHSWPTIPGYTVRRVLGEGGMGVVYLAEQETPLRRLVALKLIKPGMDTRQVVARFETERQALALMDHPNIAAVFDAGSTKEGRPYFVMEYVDGVSITDYCDLQRLSTSDRLALFVQVCAAVQHAHQKGVIHRDLKPSNVLVTERDGQPLPKVIDFGTAKAVGATWNATATQGGQGMVLGTLEYMSPEQAALSADIDTATDVYSLGVLLYELLVGRLPFDTDELRAAGYDEIRRVIRESDPPKPSVRVEHRSDKSGAAARARQTDAPGLTRQLRGDLDWITLKALEKDRKRRYATVAAFATDIGRFLDDQPVEARPPSSTYRIRKFTRRHRGAVAAAVSLFVVLVAGLAGSRAQYVRAAAALEVADYRNYVITIAVADAALRSSRFSDASERLLTVPPARRGWEWNHLFLRAERTLLTLADRTPCPSAPPAGSPLLTTDALSKTPDGKRIYFRYCQRVISWNTETLEQSVAVSPPDVTVAAAPSGRRVEYFPASKEVTPQPEKKWNVYVVDSFGVRSLSLLIDRAPACADLSGDGRILALGFRPLNTGEDSGYNPVFEPDVFEVWNVANGQRISRVNVPRPPSFDTRLNHGMDCFVRLSPDTTLLATSGAVVRVWVAATGMPVHVDPGQAGVLPQAIAFSPTRLQLAIGRRNGLVDVLDFVNSRWTTKSLDGTEIVRSQPLNESDERVRFSDVINRSYEEVRAIDFASDGRTLVSALANRVIVWDLQSARADKVLEAHLSRVTGLVVHQQLVYSSRADGTVKVEELMGSSGVTKLEGSTPPWRVRLSADGRMLAIGSDGNSLTLWHPNERKQVVVQPPVTGTRVGYGSSINFVVPLADNRTLLTGRGTLGSLTRWDSETRRSVSLATMDRLEPGCAARSMADVAVSPNDRYLAMLLGNCVVVRDLATDQTLAILPLDQQGFGQSVGRRAIFLSDDSILVTASNWQQANPLRGVGAIRRWDWATHRLIADREFAIVTDLPFAVSASKDGRRTLDLTSALLTELPVAVAASKDGRRIALSGEGGVTVWDGTLTREIGRIPVTKPLLMALSADGARLAVRRYEQTSVDVWDTATSQLLLTLTDDDVPRFLAFTPNDQLIAVNSSGIITVWKTQGQNCAQCPKSPASAK